MKLTKSVYFKGWVPLDTRFAPPQTPCSPSSNFENLHFACAHWVAGWQCRASKGFQGCVDRQGWTGPQGLGWNGFDWDKEVFLGRAQILQLWGYGLGSKNVKLLTWIAIISISLKSRFAIMCVNFKMSFVKLVDRYVDIVSSFLSTTTNSKFQAHSCTWGARNKSLQGNVH